MAMRRPGLTGQILISMLLALIVGGVLAQMNDNAVVKEYILGGVFHVLGEIFVISLKMLVVPLVFVSLVCGTSTLGDPAQLGRVGGKTLGLYVGTTCIAITIGLVMAILIAPGEGFERLAEATFDAKDAPPFTKVLIDIFPQNPIKAMAEGKMLQVIVFSILFGVSISLLGDKVKKVNEFFLELNEIIMKMITILMKLAPWGVFCLLSKVFAEQGISAIVPLAKYFFVVVFCLLLHAFGTYGSVLAFIARVNPMIFFKKIKSMILFAFSTASSNATIPVTMKTVEERLGVKKSISAFTVPLGATVNMDGTAIMQGVATVFIAQAYSQAMGVGDYLQVIATATLASVGTAGVPGVGLITLAMVLQQVGLPVEGIGLIIGVDRLLDMMRTAVNISGDASVTVAVAKSEGQFDLQVYTDPDAGGELEKEEL